MRHRGYGSCGGFVRCVQQGGEFLQDAFDGELLLNAGAGGVILHDTRIKHFDAGFRKCGGIARRHEVAGISRDPAGVADVGGDNWGGAGHGFAAVLARCMRFKRVPIIWNVRQSLYDLKHEKRGSAFVIRALAKLSWLPQCITYNTQTCLLYTSSTDRGVPPLTPHPAPPQERDHPDPSTRRVHPPLFPTRDQENPVSLLNIPTSSLPNRFMVFIVY